MARCFLPEKGGGSCPEVWERLKAALMGKLLKRCAGDECLLPEGFAFSLREEDDFRAVTPSVLGSLLERSLADAPRSGTVYTPAFLVRRMVRAAVSLWLDSRLPHYGSGEEAALLKNIRVLDLSTGAGAFAMGMLQELVRRRKRLEPECPEADLIRSILEENIYGVDISPEALDVARFRFQCALLAAGGEGVFRDHLLCGDSLDLTAGGVWRQGLAAVMEGGGFDLVIGNPPFVGEKGNRELFARLKSSPLASFCSSRMDYWYVFACVGLDALRPGGVMHLVVPNKWMANAGAAPLRRKLLADCSLLRLSDFGACRVFENARVHTMTILAERRGGGAGPLVPEYRRFCGPMEEVDAFLKHEPYRQFPLPEDAGTCVEEGLSFCSAAQWAVLEKMEAAGNFRLDGRKEITQGIVPNPDVVSSRALESLEPEAALRSGIRRGDGVFVVPRDYFHGLPERERRFLKPLYEPVLAGRYSLKEPEKVLLYLTPDNGSDQAVTLIRHLERFRPLMERRRETRMGRMKYYHVHWPRREEFFLSGPKILAARKCARPTFTYTEREAYVMMSFNVIRTERVSMKYLAALLNSRLMQFWFRLRGKMQGDAFQMDTAPILRAPVRVPHPDMLEEAERLSGALHASYCPEDDERMNRLVEDIYGLSPQEREVVIQACPPQQAGRGSMPE